jgi:molecular chaperone DnaK (HSP70)
MKIPSTISIALPDGTSLFMVYKNSTLPVEKKSVVSTFEENQTSVLIKVMYGNNMFADDNIKVAEYTLDNIPPKPKSTPKIEIHFSVNSDLILSVKTTVLDNGYTSEFEKIDLTKITPPNESNPTAANLFEDLFPVTFVQTRQPAPEEDDFTKFMFRLSSDEPFRQLFFKNKEQTFSNYNLDNEQVAVLKIISPEILASVGRNTLLGQMANFINTLKSNPDSVRCSSCKGLGVIAQKKKFLLLVSWSYDKCKTCGGIGFVK